MLEQCVSLSSTLLEFWDPEGNERDKPSDREIGQELEDFFETAKCTRFDDDIQDYAENGGRRRDKVKRG